MSESTGDISTECQCLEIKRYSRESLLGIKKLIYSKSESVPISFLAESKVLFKILKPGCKAFEELPKSQDDRAIILGPQKRAWNNGCHVTQSKRGPSDSSFSKSHKGFPDRKLRSEFKRENRGADRNFNRSNFSNGSEFTRGRKNGSEKKRSSESTNETEAEPEWFTEGPETINDTMELGMVIEDCEVKLDESKDKKAGESKVKPSDIDSAILSIGINKLPPDAPVLSSNLNESELIELLSFNKKRIDGDSSIKSIDPTHSSTLTTKQNDNPRPRLFDFLQSTVSASRAIPTSKTDINLGSELKKLLTGNASAGLNVPPLQGSIPFVADIECGNPTFKALPTAPPLPNTSTLLDQLNTAMGINERPKPQPSTGEVAPQSLVDILKLLQLKTPNIAPSEPEPRMNKNPLDNLAQNLRSNVNAPGRDHFGTPITQINSPASRPLPSDPAIDLNFVENGSTLRGIPIDEALQHMQRQHFTSQSTYPSNYRMGCGGVQNQNPVYHSINANIIPPVNLSYPSYSSNPPLVGGFDTPSVTIPTAPLRRLHNRHEHLLPLSAGGAASPTSRVADLPPTGLYAQMQQQQQPPPPQVRQNGSAPSLLQQQQRRWPSETPDLVMPPSASAADLYRYDQAVARNVSLNNPNTGNHHSLQFGRRAS